MSGRFRERASEQGIVVSDALETTGRQAFVQVDPEVLENIDARRLQDALPSSTYVEFDPLRYLEYLPDLEAEIFWLIWHCGKTQPDVAELVQRSQSTISYRYQRAHEKMAYLVMLTAVDVREMVDSLDFLRPKERDILHDLFFYANQKAVGERHGVGQSSVKWIARKTKTTLETLEPQDPERYFNVLGLVYLLFRNWGIRIRNE